MSTSGYIAYTRSVMAASTRTTIPRPRDAKATQERLVLAAVEELSERGLAGARIDRIAERAGANKRLIYAYFGNKDELFDAVLARTLGVLTESVPFTPEDLPGYAGALFDRLVENPTVLRLATWRNFERAAASDAERASYAGKVAAIRAAQKAGAIDAEIPPADLLAMLMSLVTSWLSAPTALKELAGGADPMSPRQLKQHRRALVEVVARAVTPR
jgi:AcrR family transcriptional regulator